MTKRIVEECFEPCIKMLIQDLFVIEGVEQYKNVSIPADTPQPNVDLVSSLQFNIDVQNIESPILTLNLGREFTEAKDFTKFVRALISISAQSIDRPPPNPPKNVIVSPLVTVDSPDSDNPHGGIFRTPIKVKATINEEGKTYIIDRTTDDLNKPYIATCFFGTTK